MGAGGGRVSRLAAGRGPPAGLPPGSALTAFGPGIPSIPSRPPCTCASPCVFCCARTPADDPKVARELQFFERVKQRLRNKEAYADFLKCLNMFAEDILAKQELVR